MKLIGAAKLHRKSGVWGTRRLLTIRKRLYHLQEAVVSIKFSKGLGSQLELPLPSRSFHLNSHAGKSRRTKQGLPFCA